MSFREALRRHALCRGLLASCSLSSSRQLLSPLFPPRLFFRCLWLRRLRRRRGAGGRAVAGVITGGLHPSSNRSFPAEVHSLSPDKCRFGVFFRVHPVRLPNICVHEHHSEKHTTDERTKPDRTSHSTAFVSQLSRCLSTASALLFR